MQVCVTYTLSADTSSTVDMSIEAFSASIEKENLVLSVNNSEGDTYDITLLVHEARLGDKHPAPSLGKVASIISKHGFTSEVNKLDLVLSSAPTGFRTTSVYQLIGSALIGAGVAAATAFLANYW